MLGPTYAKWKFVREGSSGTNPMGNIRNGSRGRQASGSILPEYHFAQRSYYQIPSCRPNGRSFPSRQVSAHESPNTASSNYIVRQWRLRFEHRPRRVSNHVYSVGGVVGCMRKRRSRALASVSHRQASEYEGSNFPRARNSTRTSAPLAVSLRHSTRSAQVGCLRQTRARRGICHPRL